MKNYTLVNIPKSAGVKLYKAGLVFKITNFPSRFDVLSSPG